MTELLQKAFDQASRLPPDEQDLLAAWLLTEMASEDEFDRKIAATADKLSDLGRAALAEYRSGSTQELDPERL